MSEMKKQLEFIDVTFDFRNDAGGRDVDQASPTLKRFHQLLWSKQLPSGENFLLSDKDGDSYLSFKSKSETFYLSSDSISNSYRNSKRLSPVLIGLDVEAKKFQDVGNTIGGYIIFPSKTNEPGMSINQSRGISKTISDRFDLTLECIRLHYLRKPNPLEAVLNRNAKFFELFNSFSDYAEFFLLQDLLNPNLESILYFTQINEIGDWGLPRSKEEYLLYMDNSTQFTRKRNERIQKWSDNHLGKR